MAELRVKIQQQLDKPATIWQVVLELGRAALAHHARQVDRAVHWINLINNNKIKRGPTSNDANRVVLMQYFVVLSPQKFNG